MKQYLTRIALNNATLYPNKSVAIDSNILAQLVEEYQSVTDIISRLSSHYFPSFLEQLIYQKAFPKFIDIAEIDSWLIQIEQRLNVSLPVGTSYRLSVLKHQNGSKPLLNIRLLRYGISTESRIPGEFFFSTEYQRILSFSNKINGLFEDCAYVQRGDRSEKVTDIPQMVSWLLAEARRGQNVQRYKGLGEMNPEQLWDTTMDKSKRRLLQVKIEDAISADETFNILMGDNVEPRREFIEAYALQASNLDI